MSAIPEWIWDLFELFMQGRAMRLPVRDGGLLAQPLIVRRAFPIWEELMATLDRERHASSDVAALAAMLGTRRR